MYVNEQPKTGPLHGFLRAGMIYLFLDFVINDKFESKKLVFYGWKGENSILSPLKISDLHSKVKCYEPNEMVDATTSNKLGKFLTKIVREN